MDAERWRMLNELFHDVISRPSEERRARIDRACRDDRALIEEVDRLVRAHEHAASFVIHIPASIATDFTGTDRFAVRHVLGVGGMGVVYEVHDRVRDEIVALKTLLRVNAAEIYRLKQEFRGLADVAHPNLVSLYELFVEEERCFFIMERVTGVTFVDYVRGNGPTTDATALCERLRHVFPQLVDGVSELHRQGKLHRDIKPSNVLVTPERRVVILDFGLLTELSSQYAVTSERLAGTPAYMSPEQTQGADVSAASDWYSVGVTVYEALTGRLPFVGSLSEIVGRKTESDPPSPAMIAPAVPRDVSALCMDLLCRNPQTRVSGTEAVRRLMHSGSMTPTRVATTTTDLLDSPFVGRARQLHVLDDAFGAVRRGHTAVVYVSGPSGIGKTALVRRFLDRLSSQEDVVILSGRCYEHESVPYKALDGVVDSLSHYVRSLPQPLVERLMPRDAGALWRVFPVLKRVETTATMPSPEQGVADPLVLRARAFAALRELLTRLANSRRIVIYIDDLHWADADSAVLLEDLLRPPGAPAVLAVACCRSEELRSKPFLQALLDHDRLGTAITLPLGPLDEDEASDMIAALIPTESRVKLDERRTIAREAEGNPFFLDQLTRYVTLTELKLDEGPTLQKMIDGRLRRLTLEARHFVEILATCGRPMSPSLVYGACGLKGDERPLIAILRTAHLVRSSGSAERVEIYHDRIREALTAQIDPVNIRRIHRVMAETLVSRQVDDPDALFVHYCGAGNDDAAATQAGRAALKAETGLAFDRAAAFYRRALELAPGADAHGEWKARLAKALANAGRPADAGEVYLQAAAGVDPTQRLELQRHGAEQFLIGGHIDRGMDVLRSVLDATGMHLARGPRTALASLMWRRAQLRWRGLAFREQSVEQIPVDDLRRIDTCWSVVTGLALVDSLHALDYNTRHLLLALDAGEPYRIARSLAVEAALSATGGDRSRRRTTELTERARVLSEHVGHPHAIALSALMAGFAACLNGEWRTAAALSDRALGILRDRCVGVTWELNVAHNVLIGSLLYLGEFEDASERLPALVASARDSGNLYIETDLRTRMMTLMWLAADDPSEAERQANEVMDRWSHRAFHLQHYRHIQARTMIALYRRDGDAAWRLFAENHAMLKRTRMLRVQLLRIEASYLRGRCALAAAPNRNRRPLLAIARAEARRIAREKMRWSDPLALLLEAGIANIEADMHVAEQLLRAAADGFDRAEMKLYSAVARRRLGILVGGERGRDVVRHADDWMASQMIKNPPSMTRMLAPGFADDWPA